MIIYVLQEISPNFSGNTKIQVMITFELNSWINAFNKRISNVDLKNDNILSIAGSTSGYMSATCFHTNLTNYSFWENTKCEEARDT